MHDLIDIVEEHTNHPCAEQAAQMSLISLIISGLIYCVALLV